MLTAFDNQNVALRCPFCSATVSEVHQEWRPPPDAARVGPQRHCTACGKGFELYLVERPLHTIAPQLVANPTLGAAVPVVPEPFVPEPFVPTQAPVAPPPIPAVPPAHPAQAMAAGAGSGVPSSGVPLPAMPPLATAPLPTPQEIAASACANHPNNQAMTACQHCHRCICNLCATPIEGKTYCPQCFEGLRARGVLETSQRSFATPKMVLGLGWVTLLLGWASCIGLVTGPLGIYLGVRALAEINQRPGLPGRQKVIAGMILSVLGMIATIGFYFVLAALGVWDELGKKM